MKAHQIKVLTKVLIHWRIVIVRLHLFSIFLYINTLCKYSNFKSDITYDALIIFYIKRKTIEIKYLFIVEMVKFGLYETEANRHRLLIRDV